MSGKRYRSPILFLSIDEEDQTVIGQGTGQGTYNEEGLSYNDWWYDIAWEGTNPDADYNGDGAVNYDDYVIYCKDNGIEPEQP